MNLSQKEAVFHLDGPLLIIAGPGTGKTYTLIERTVNIIQSRNVEPKNILLATFTEKAASELVTRISQRLQKENISLNLNEMYIGTLHSICLRILEENREFTRLKKNYTLWDDFDQKYRIYQNLERFRKIENYEVILGENQSGSWNQTEKLVYWLNLSKEEILDLEQLVSSETIEVQVLGKLAKEYNLLLEEENALDFATIQFEAWKLLKDNPSLLANLQEQLQYLMIDEYQDTNTIQEAIILLISGSKKNLCVVGDDDQGLYRFRGATIRNILEFESTIKHKTFKQVVLEENYRSHPEIISFYSAWMEQREWTDGGVRFRYAKNISAAGKEKDKTHPAVLRVSSGEGQEGWQEEVLDFISFMKKKGKLADLNQIAFLFRSVKNDRVLSLAEYLEENGIPIYSPRSNLFFSRLEVKLMIGALLFTFPQANEAMRSHWKGSSEPEVWEYYDECLADFIAELNNPELKDLKVWAVGKARKHSNLTENTDYAFSGLFYELLQFPLFSRFLGQMAFSGVTDSRPARNLAQFSKLLTKFEYLNRISVFSEQKVGIYLHLLFNTFLRFLHSGGIEEFEDPLDYAPSGCVSFMTIHQSKGLEFPIVLIDSLEAVPRKQYSDLNQLLQEQYYHKPPFEPIEETKFYDFWRLYYTGFSRAKHLLLLSTAENSVGQGKSPSAYLSLSGYSELPSWRDHKKKIGQIDLDTIHKADIKQEYSFTSHIALYEGCARQYEFYKALEFAPVRRNAMLFGRLVHETIEDIHKAVIRGEAHLINPENVTTWFEQNYRYLSFKERMYFSELALKNAFSHVERYVSYRGEDWSKIKDAEVDVSMIRETYILNGQIDLLEGEHDTVEIVDFKTEKKPDLNAHSERLEHFRRQMEVYSFIVEERLGKKVSKIHLFFTGEKDGNPMVSYPLNQTSTQKTIREFDQIVDKIEQKDFRITKRPERLCPECDMRRYCDRIGT
ncbi:ATP-dependent helicase [Leptospira levettii]|uniref:ATP-dependent helicase n=1 Tax=Leptospira levettii TaxID=2023178 RepID=UPI001EEB5D10|nr:ATP-dependent DNA helicase [Leptospira levettii]MCG6150300.1 ATP-dependent helicase [Leptospira levettii]